MSKKIKTLKSKITSLDIKQIAPHLKDTIISFVKYNRQFISYVILCLISCMFLRYYTIGNFFNFYATFFDFSIIVLFGCLAYFIKPKKQFWYFFLGICVVTLINIINSVYYAFFTDYASFGLLASAGQTTEVTSAVFEKLKPSNFIYLIMPALFFIINRYLTKKDYFSIVEKIESGKKLFVSIAIVGGISLFINISTLTSTDLSRLSKQWNRSYIVERFGILIYQGNDFTQTLRSKINSMFGYEEAAKNFTEYFQENPYKESKNKYTNMFKGYNVVVIHMESIMSFLLNLKINNQEVTPNLNKLLKESMYFDNFYPQVSVGTSSDTEFTFNTSLLPVQSGTAFVSYYNREYTTLEKLLAEKKYYTFSMHGNKASMWNRSKMHPSLGYMDFYSEEYYDIDEVVGLGLSDRSFFRQSEEIIKDINDMVNEKKEYKNYMGTIITLSNHTPFDDESYLNGDDVFDTKYHTGKKDGYGNEIIYDYLDNTIMGNYIKSVHYADECLGEFFDYIRTHDEYNKTLFVMYGDHAAQLSKSQFGKFINYDFNTGEQKSKDDPTYIKYDYYYNELFKNTPLILWTKDKKITGTVSYPMGMIDVLPTISNMLGIKNEYALGHDIFETKNNNMVIFPNGNFLTNKVYYHYFRNEFRVLGGDNSLIIDADYIDEKKEYAERILELSNDIVVYDLIKKLGSSIGE